MRFAIALTAVALTGCGTTAKDAYIAHGADALTTGIAISRGAVETNPLGIAAIPLKVALTEYAKTLSEQDKPKAFAAISSVTWGAVANNVCIIVGGANPVCVLIGIGYGVANWTALQAKE